MFDTISSFFLIENSIVFKLLIIFVFYYFSMFICIFILFIYDFTNTTINI